VKLIIGTFAALLGTYAFAADGTKDIEQAEGPRHSRSNAKHNYKF
jgi:hypothetical protein